MGDENSGDDVVSEALVNDPEFHKVISEYIDMYLNEGEEEALKLMDKYFHNREFIKKFDDFLKSEDNE